MKKNLFLALALITISQAQALRYGKRTGKDLLKTIDVYCNTIDERYNPSLKQLAFINDKKASETEKLVAKKKILLFAQEENYTFSFSQFFWNEDKCRTLKEIPIIAYTESI